MLQALGIEPSSVQEDCSKTKHWTWLKTNHSEYPHLDYLERHRIEIDSVLADVGAERLWRYLQDTLASQFPRRNYNRAVEIPSYTEPGAIGDFTRLLASKQAQAVAGLNSQMSRDLEDVEGFLEIEKIEEAIQTRQLAEIKTNPTLKQVMSKLQDLAAWLENQ